MIHKIFEPVRVGPVSLANRLVMTAMHLGYLTDGEVNDRLVEMYRARARGGVGLIVVGVAEIDEQAGGIDSALSIQDDRFIPGLQRLTEAVHEEGAKIALSLHMGGYYSVCFLKGLPVLAPSKVTNPITRQEATPMTLEDIERVQEDYGRATTRAKQAGFDAVEVLSATYLISQFLSEKTNKREDGYGGPLENRMRFGAEVVEKVCREAGEDMAVMVRVAGNDFVPGGCTNREARVFAQVCQEAGADAINVTGGWHETRIPQITHDVPRAGLTYLAKGIKEAVDIPVIACNRINDPLLAEELLKEGICDLVGMARAYLADPDFPNKAREGRFEEIRRCVACNQRCFDHVMEFKPVGCMVNPQAGRETERRIVPTQEPKRILVAGAGPAGCEFALTAARRGHQLVLCEKENDVGGQLRWAADPTGKSELLNIPRYYRAMLDRLGVEVRCGEKVTAELVTRETPDLVVVATGAVPVLPPVPPVDAVRIVQAWDVLKGNTETGSQVVVVGGGLVGLETALFLARQGTITPEQLYFLMLHQAESPEFIRELMVRGTKRVTVIEMAPRIGQDIGISTRWVITKELRTRGVELITDATMKQVSPGKLAYTKEDGKECSLPCDTVVLAVGSEPDHSLAKTLKESGVEVMMIGDAAHVGKIGEAIEAGFELACEV